jgi:hypothetical protein
MKKLTAVLLAVLTAMALTACGETEDSNVLTREEDNERPARTEAAAIDANVPITSEDFAKEHGIALDTYYFPFANPNWGIMEFISDGTFKMDIPELEVLESTWSADVNGVYVANYEGDEHQINIYNDGDIVEFGSIIGHVSGKDPATTYSGTFKYDGDHDWLDILEFGGGFDASYQNLDYDGNLTEQGGASYLVYDNKIIVTQNVYDGTNRPAMLFTNDGGETFEDDYYTYYPYDGGSSSSTEYTDWAEYAESLGDRSEYRDRAAELGIEIDGLYYSDLEDGAYIFVSEDGLMYVYEPNSGQTVPFVFEIDGDNLTLYYSDGSYVSELTFDGYSFYETDTGTYFEPY